MPADADSLAALAGLAASSTQLSAAPEAADLQTTVTLAVPGAAATTPSRDVARPLTWVRRPVPSATRRRLVTLAAASAAGGLLAGLVVPVAAAQGSPDLAGAAPVMRLLPVVDWSAPSGGSAAAVGASVVASRRAAEQAPQRPAAGAVAAARAYHPTMSIPPTSGTGRRIVYSQRRGHVWIVGSDDRVLRDYAVTGRRGRPSAGTYRVFSKSRTAVNPKAKVRFDLMVRFAHGITGAPIGFHTIPRWFDGTPIQREDQLGRMIGAGGCVRQSSADARWLYSWVSVGDTVVVLR